MTQAFLIIVSSRGKKKDSGGVFLNLSSISEGTPSESLNILGGRFLFLFFLFFSPLKQGWFYLFYFLLLFELQGLTAGLVLLGDFFTMWINQCYELGPWGFGNVIGFR